MDTSWDKFGDYYKSLNLFVSSKPGKECLWVEFYNQDQKTFNVNSLKGGDPCPSGKKIMNALILYAEEEGYKIGFLIDDSEFLITKNKSEARWLSSRILNAIEWGFDCGDYAYSYYNQFGFQYSSEDNANIKKAEDYFKHVKLGDFIAQLQGDKKQMWEDLINDYKASTETTLRQFLMKLRNKNEKKYGGLIYATFSSPEFMINENEKFWYRLSKSYDMVLYIGFEAIKCTK